MAADEDRNANAGRGCIKSSKGPWVVRRTTRNGSTVTKYRYPSDKERLNNMERERNRRAVTHNIFAGLRAHGSYQLPKNSDTNDLLKALCAEAGWHVEEDGTVRRKRRRLEVAATSSSISADSPSVCMSMQTLQQAPGDDQFEDQIGDYCTCQDNVGSSSFGFQGRNFLSLQLDQAEGPHHSDLNLSLSLSLSPSHLQAHHFNPE